MIAIERHRVNLCTFYALVNIQNEDTLTFTTMTFVQLMGYINRAVLISDNSVVLQRSVKNGLPDSMLVFGKLQTLQADECKLDHRSDGIIEGHWLLFREDVCI